MLFGCTGWFLKDPPREGVCCWRRCLSDVHLEPSQYFRFTCLTLKTLNRELVSALRLTRSLMRKQHQNKVWWLFLPGVNIVFVQQHDRNVWHSWWEITRRGKRRKRLLLPLEIRWTSGRDHRCSIRKLHFDISWLHFLNSRLEKQQKRWRQPLVWINHLCLRSKVDICPLNEDIVQHGRKNAIQSLVFHTGE